MRYCTDKRRDNIAFRIGFNVIWQLLKETASVSSGSATLLIGWKNNGGGAKSTLCILRDAHNQDNTHVNYCCWMLDGFIWITTGFKIKKKTVCAQDLDTVELQPEWKSLMLLMYILFNALNTVYSVQIGREVIYNLTIFVPARTGIPLCSSCSLRLYIYIQMCCTIRFSLLYSILLEKTTTYVQPPL